MMGRIEIELGRPTGAGIAEEQATRFARDCRACSASRISRSPAAARTTSRRWREAILDDLGDRQPESFRVCARRADKRFPFTSPQIEREVGGLIKQATRLARRSRAIRR